jgi:hypothetical protein
MTDFNQSHGYYPAGPVTDVLPVREVEKPKPVTDVLPVRVFRASSS